MMLKYELKDFHLLLLKNTVVWHLKPGEKL